MNQIKNKKGAWQLFANRNFLLLVSLFLVLAFVFNWFSPASLSIPGMELQKKTFSFAGESGVATSPYFGSLQSSDKLDFQTTGRVGFCGDNDGRVTISNNLNVGQSLYLSSSMSSTKNPCEDNFVEATIILPKGKLTGVCSTSASESYDGISKSVCSVGSYSQTSIWHYECPGKGNIAWREANCADPKKESFTIILDKPTEIKIRTSSSVGRTGSASSSVTLNFEPEQIQTEDSTSDETSSDSSSSQDAITDSTTSTQKLSLIDRINLWIENLISSIFGGRN